MDYDSVAVEDEERGIPARMDMRHRIFYGCVAIFIVSKIIQVLWLFFFFNVLKGKFSW